MPSATVRPTRLITLPHLPVVCPAHRPPAPPPGAHHVRLLVPIPRLHPWTSLQAYLRLGHSLQSSNELGSNSPNAPEIAYKAKKIKGYRANSLSRVRTVRSQSEPCSNPVCTQFLLPTGRPHGKSSLGPSPADPLSAAPNACPHRNALPTAHLVRLLVPIPRLDLLTSPKAYLRLSHSLQSSNELGSNSLNAPEIVCKAMEIKGDGASAAGRVRTVRSQSEPCSNPVRSQFLPPTGRPMGGPP